MDRFNISVIRDPKESNKKTKVGKNGFEDNLAKEINENNLFQSNTKI